MREASSSSICPFALARVTTISRIFIFGGGGGWVEKKIERVLEKENFELGKNQASNWGLTKFWTLSNGQGNKKYEFQKRGERMGKFVKGGQRSRIGKQTRWQNLKVIG